MRHEGKSKARAELLESLFVAEIVLDFAVVEYGRRLGAVVEDLVSLHRVALLERMRQATLLLKFCFCVKQSDANERQEHEIVAECHP